MLVSLLTGRGQQGRPSAPLPFTLEVEIRFPVSHACGRGSFSGLGGLE